MPTFIFMAGLPGTGKSTLAQALAKELNGIVLSKDTLRAALFPGLLTDYSRQQDDLCFGMLLDAARYLSQRRRTDFIFLDGRTFSQKEQIEQAIQVAQDTGCAWKIIRATCADSIAEARLVKDANTHPAANRTVALYREVRARSEPITNQHLEIDTSQPLEVSVLQALAYLRGAADSA